MRRLSLVIITSFFILSFHYFFFAILFLSVPIHPSDGKKPGSENFETLCAGAQKKNASRTKEVSQVFYSLPR